MKLSDMLRNLGGMVAYYPSLRRITGGARATILLCQLSYWDGRGIYEDGWIYKTAAELSEETGLSYDEQVTARKQLVERGLIEEYYARLEHRMLFRIKVDAINEA